MSRKKKRKKSNQSRLSEGRSKEVLFGYLEQAVILEFALGKDIEALCEKYSLTKREVSRVLNRFKQIKGISEFGQEEREFFQDYKEKLIEERKIEINLQLTGEFMRAGYTTPKGMTDLEEILAYEREVMKDSFKPFSSYDEVINLLGLDEELE